MADIRVSGLGGIPFGDTSGRPSSPGVGQLYSNGQLQRLELYTGATYGWQNIVAETPGVTGYTGTLYENSGGTITITGTNFSSGATTTLVGTDGTEYNAISTSVTNLTQLVATFGPISGSKEPYDIKVTNPSNLYGVYYDILSVNDAPVWATAAGSLGSFNEGQSVSATVSATDEENNTITYSSSNLPAWLSINSSTGVISGTAPGVASNTTYSFSISASDGNNISTRNFSILINSILTWNTTAGSLGNIYDLSRTGYSYSLSATGLGNTLSYSVTSGSLPTGLSLNSSTGVISGNASAVVTDTTSNFTITVSDGTLSASRAFSLTVKSPVKVVFSHTGSSQTLSVPSDLQFIKSKLWGAAGGEYNASVNLNNSGGAGGYTETIFNVLPGENTYTIIVGGGTTGNSWNAYGGGGSAVNGGSGGGGCSAILSGSITNPFVSTTTGLGNGYVPQSNLLALSGAIGVVAVAGGGGGAGWYNINNQVGGNGGGLSGLNGTGYTTTTGGTQSSSTNGNQSSGAGKFQGGYITANQSSGGSGGGGGGWYGGGASQGPSGSNASGAGGSGFIGYVNGSTSSVLTANQSDSISYIDSTTRTNGTRTYTNSKCLASASGTFTPPNNTDSDYVAGIGVATYYPGNEGTSKSSGNGLVVISY